MNRDGDDSWDSYLDDQHEGTSRQHWDEDDWEGFLLRQDALNAKYQELYETLREHPDRDELIAREMRWNLPEDMLLAPHDDGDLPDADDCWTGEEAFVADLDAIDSYQRSQQFALTVDRQLTARLRERLCSDSDAARAVRSAIDVANHIANGHGIGYERDTLCGNIACCRRALSSLAECFDTLLVLRRRGVLPHIDADELLTRCRATNSVVAQRIDELRQRAWWC